MVRTENLFLLSSAKKIKWFYLGLQLGWELREVWEGDGSCFPPKVGAWCVFLAQPWVWELGWQPWDTFLCVQGVRTEISPGCLFTLVLVKSRPRVPEPFSDVFKWMKTLKMRSLPICCERLGDRPECSSPRRRNSVKWLQGKGKLSPSWYK